MIDHVTFLKCDAPGCLARFSSEGLLAVGDRYVVDAAIRRGWFVEAVPVGTGALKILCPAHSEKVRESQTLPAEKAVRLLISNPPALRSAPPFLVGRLKLLLSQFNIKTHQWKDAQ